MSGRRLRKAARFLHLMINGAWLGAVFCSLLLVLAGKPQDRTMRSEGPQAPGG